MSTPAPAREPVPTDVRRRTQVFVLLLIATIALYLIGLPVALGVLATAPAALFFGGWALIATRGRSAMGALRIGVVCGMVVGVLATFLGLGMVIFFDALQDLQECQARAVTAQAERQCVSDYEEAYQARMRQFGVVAP